MEKAATSALRREVAVEGSMELVPTLWPTVEVKGLRISNPHPWAETDFVRVDLARVQLDLLPLLIGDIHLGEITAEGVSVRLERNAEGEANWQLDPVDAAAEPTIEADTDSDDDAAPSFQFVGLDEIALRRIDVSYKDGDTDETTTFALDDLICEAPRGQAVDITIHGSIRRQPYTVSIDGGPLAGLATVQEPWPAKVTAEIGGSSLQVEGVLDETLEGKAIDLTFKLAGDRLEDLEAIAGSALPPIGAYGLSGRVHGSATAYGLTELEGTFGDTALTGEVVLDISDQRPLLSGTLAIALLDLEPFLPNAPESEPVPDEAPTDEASFDPEFSTGDLELGKLQLVDVDFNLSIGRVANAPGDISNATLSLKVERGILAAPMSVSIGQVPFNGALEIDAAGDIPELNLSLKAEQTDIGKLAIVVAGAEGIEGRIENAEFTASGRGTNPQTIVNGLDMRFAVNDASLLYGNEAGGQPVNFSLDTGEISMDGADQEMAVIAAGALLDEPFLLALSGGGLATLLKGEPWPLDLSASSRDAELHVRGTVSPETDPESIELELQLAGKRVGDLAVWLGASPSVNMSYAISGRAVRTKDEVRVSALDARVGRTRLGGELGWIKGHANGRLDFAVWPEDLDAGLFDLWAVNLVLAVLPDLDAEPTSVVNCLIGRFDLNDGIMDPDALMFDTTEMRVKGEGKVDFTAEKVEFLLKPRAKIPQMFGAATPVKVEGTFSDFDVGLRSGAVLGTILQMTTSVVTAPVKRIFSGSLPADGKDVCDAPIRRSAGIDNRAADQ